ncbi:DUF1538 domain-containing protein [Mailhella massiliensis]|uniref:DUF1538 domain-containing protein n=1 Tax=Mailhella massiliensis TaxID=1903261 RepID=UPI0023F2C855|nr:DUF1538 domain-containing protein [Mailhella massiliensis]
MLFIEKCRESVISVIPVVILVLLLHLTVAPLGDDLPKFLTGAALFIVGLGLFLVGADIGVLPVGQKVGSTLTGKRNLALMLAVGFVVGFIITVAEPDVQVLAAQVTGVAPVIAPMALVCIIAAGVGFFVAVAMGRIIFQLPLKTLLFVCYGAVFLCALLASDLFLGIGFDAGGATTGPMTVPFIMALGVGVAAVRGGSNAGDDSFGFVGLASVGPILAVLMLGVFASPAVPETSSAAQAAQEGLAAHFLHLLPEVTHEVAMALGPLALLFLLFRLFLIRLSRRQTLRMVMGLIYTFIGVILFFLGVKGGFMPTGDALGALLSAPENRFLLIPVALVLGAVVVCAEPAVWILTEQVEQVSGGAIRRRLMLIALSAGVSLAVGIAMYRVMTGTSLWFFLIPGYAAAMLLMRLCPRMFTAIAFDSGGVASGPMASTFILAFMLGVSKGVGGNPAVDAFGCIAMIAMTPLIAIQLLGIVFSRKTGGRS